LTRTRTKKPEPLSLRAYAERRNVSVQAVSKAVAAGRLRESVVQVDGQPKIADPEIADREWEANTRPRVDRPPAAEQGAAATSADEVPDYFVSRARREAAAARREAAQADLSELEVAERKGELVSVAKARADVMDKFTIVKTRMLGVPSRLAQRLPHVAVEVVPIVEELVREALEELAADGGEADGGHELDE
jgi:hypothetical protein